MPIRAEVIRVKGVLTGRNVVVRGSYPMAAAAGESAQGGGVIGR
ncbi:MAG TPA: hypothetical protein VG674_12785 [Amycolatopsis sp.]|nr:hypothetical protein [Amycolatopsis sp.]